MSSKRSDAHSAYERYTYSYQHHAAKTRGRLLANGVGFAVGGIVFVPVSVLFSLYLLRSGIAAQLPPFFAIAGSVGLIVLPFIPLLAFFYGVWLILKAVFGKCRVVACPFCGKEHALFREVRGYICEECGHVLRLSGEGTELVKVACPHCALEWAANRDGGDTRCFCCGARLTLSGDSAVFSTAALLCPACAASNPDGSYFCRSCGGTLSAMQPLAAPSKKVAEDYTLEATPDSEGMDPITVRAAPPIGLLYRATSRLNGVIAQANEQPDPTVPDLKLLREVRECLKQIEEAVIKRPEYAPQARTQLGCLTHIVARLLKGLAFPQDQESTLSEFMLLSKELPALFNGLASRVNAGADPSLSVAPWPTELITLKPRASANVNLTTLVDRTHLDDWVKRNSLDGPLTPMSAPVRIPDTHRPSIPAGWYPDPTDNRALCWWDGEQWQPATRHSTAPAVTPPQTRATTPRSTSETGR